MESPTKFWPLIHSVIQEFWRIIEPRIEDAAVREDIPIELYLYSELGLDHFSIDEFQKRDPFTNPEQFEKLFARLDVKGWIEPIPNGRYRVTENARDSARRIIQAGDLSMTSFESLPGKDLERLRVLLKQIVMANEEASEPPQKWAILNRFRVADKESESLVQIREYLMDLFAYRDDSYLSAARPHFNQAGIVWIVLGAIWDGDAVTAEQIAEKMAFRSYEVEDYEVAIQAAVEVGWVEEADTLRIYRPTQKGREMREQVEQLTDEYFYRPWSVLTQNELDELYDLLVKLRDQLHILK